MNNNKKMLSTVIYGVALFFLASTQLTIASSCKLYEDSNYRGTRIKIHKDESLDYVGRQMNNRISSVKVPSGCKLVTFEDANFEGYKQVFRSDSSYVGNQANNSISSAKCKCNHSNNNNSSNNNNNSSNHNNNSSNHNNNSSNHNNGSSNHNNGSSNYTNQCILYDELNYLGRNILIDKNEERSYVGDNINNKISSVKVPSNCKLIVYEGVNFRGKRTEFKNAFSSIGQRWDNRISSAECRCHRSNNNNSSNHNNSSSNYTNQCILYTELNYLGRNILINKNQETSYVGDNINNKISSVKVPSSCKLIVYDNANFRGYKTEFKRGFSSIGQQWDNRISSAECRCGKY